MKKKIVKLVRGTLPPSAVHSVEEVYRRSRVHLASARYGYPARGLRVVAVTGTNGKTTTANYLNEIFKAAGYTTALFTTAVIEIAGERKLNDLNATVALTAEMQAFFKQAKEAKVDFVVLEITSHALQQHKLATVPIECAVMTNLTQDHLDYHGTMQHYAQAKGMLFASKPRYIVLNRDDEWFDFFDKYQAGEHKISYGTHESSDAQIKQYKLYKKGSEVTVLFDHQTKIEMGSHLPGKYNIYNYVAAASAAYALGVPLEAIVDGIANLEAIPGRYERVAVDKPYDVIVDYAHTPDALTKLFESAREMTKGRLILVFGATGDRDKSKRPIMGEIAAKHVDRIFVTDEESYNEDPSTIRQDVLKGVYEAGGEAKTKEIADRREAIAEALSVARKDDTLLITGMGHEVFRIVNGEKLPWNDAEIVRQIIDNKKIL
jgi:UDP-N-acetylmuramoyl-L-alanyl-D-glutamate--2,6-diaminopimelate ligase